MVPDVCPKQLPLSVKDLSQPLPAVTPRHPSPKLPSQNQAPENS